MEIGKILPYTTIFFLCSLLLGIFLNTTSLIVLFTFSVLGSWKSNSLPPLNNKLLWLLIFFVFYEITLIFTFNTDLKASLSELFTFVPLLLIVISFFLNSKKLNNSLYPKLELAFLVTCLLSAVLNLVYGIYRGIILPTGINYYFLSYDYLGSVFGIQAYYLSLFYLIGCLFIIKHKKKLKLGYIYLLILWLSIFFLASRMTIFISLIIIPAFMYIKIANKKDFFILGFISLILFISALLFNPILRERIKTINSKTTNYSGVELRKKIWENSFEVFKESPLIGHGMQNTNEKLIDQFERKRFRAAIRNRYHSHNQFIQTSLDSGLIGLLLLLAIIINTGYNLYQNRQITYIFAYVCLIGTMLTESLFQRQWGLFLFAFFVGISLVKPLKEDDKIEI